jgi:transcription antitermination factor NusG
VTAYTIGMTVPPAAPALGITSGAPWPPTWFCLTVAPQRERATREYLRAQGVYAFYPSREKIRHQHGKKRITEHPIVSGYVYAQFRAQPQWDEMKRVRRLITGVFCWGGVPVEIHPAVIRHLQGLTVEAERLREAKEAMAKAMREAKMPKPGDQARVTEGPFAMPDFFVEVESVNAGRAWVNTVFGRMEVALETLERKA